MKVRSYIKKVLILENKLCK